MWNRDEDPLEEKGSALESFPNSLVGYLLFTTFYPIRKVMSKRGRGASQILHYIIIKYQYLDMELNKLILLGNLNSIYCFVLFYFFFFYIFVYSFT